MSARLSKQSNYIDVLGWFQDVPSAFFCHYGILWGDHLDIAQWPSVSFRWHGHPSLSRYDMATYTRFNSMVTWRILALVNACYRLSAWLGMFGLVETSKTCWGCIHQFKCSLNRLQHIWCLTRLLWLTWCWTSLFKVPLHASSQSVQSRPRFVLAMFETDHSNTMFASTIWINNDQ